MPKKENEMLRLGGILCAITLCVALVLSIANLATADRIEQLKIQAQNEARKSVLRDASDFEQIKLDLSEYNIVSNVYKGLNNGSTVGYCVGVEPTGFGGTIEMIVGIDSNGNITGINLVSDQETPGLGSKAKEPEFKGQFEGKSSSKDIEVIKNGSPAENEVIAISGATITSKAVTKGVNAAVKIYNEQLK